jgi:hypothetical protein
VNEGDFIRTRLVRWNEELARIDAATSNGSPRSGAGAAALAGRALEACGHLLRRLARSSAGTDAGLDRVERVLRALPSGAVAAWAASADLGALEARLRRATDEAVEAALPETPKDAESWAASAREGLEARDAFESQLVAMCFREGLGFEAERSVRERLAAALKAQDLALSPRSRRLVTLNAYRREMRDALDPEHRKRAWWFTSRADCDDLLPMLAGEKKASEHVERCDECQRDLARARRADLPRMRHLSEDDLWKYDLGLLSGAERAYAERHARACGACAEALAALAEGEQEIAALALTGSDGAGVRPMTLETARGGAEEPEVLADDADFRLFVSRGQER